ncbi:MAG TPA: site-2 protease family protein [Chthoniobacteraceae bacterium]|jgi:Zn-dependent protease
MQFDFADAIIWYVVFLYSIVSHEAAHAWASYRLGDDTAYRGGQVSLDPTPHVKREPFGMVAVPILSYIIGGWMIGWASAPYDPQWALRHPRRAAWMALAGPAANLIFVILAGIALRAGLQAGFFDLPSSLGFTEMVAGSGGKFAEGAATFLSILFSLNLLLFTFNLLPLPPLDGASIPLLFMPERLAGKYQEFIWQPAFNLIGLVVAWNVFGSIFGPVQLFAMRLLYAGL